MTTNRRVLANEFYKDFSSLEGNLFYPQSPCYQQLSNLATLSRHRLFCRTEESARLGYTQNLHQRETSIRRRHPRYTPAILQPVYLRH